MAKMGLLDSGGDPTTPRRTDNIRGRPCSGEGETRFPLIAGPGGILHRLRGRGRIPLAPEPFPLDLREETTPPREVGRTLHEQPDAPAAPRIIVEPPVALERVPACVPNVPHPTVTPDRRRRIATARLSPEPLHLARIDLHTVRDQQVVIVPPPESRAHLRDRHERDRSPPMLANPPRERLPPRHDPDTIGRRGVQPPRIPPHPIRQPLQVHPPYRRVVVRPPRMTLHRTPRIPAYPPIRDRTTASAPPVRLDLRPTTGSRASLAIQERARPGFDPGRDRKYSSHIASRPPGVDHDAGRCKRRRLTSSRSP